jgi:hypothetical protein
MGRDTNRSKAECPTHPLACKHPSKPSDPQPKLNIINPHDFRSKAELASPGAARTSEVVDKCWKDLIWFDISLRGQRADAAEWNSRPRFFGSR